MAFSSVLLLPSYIMVVYIEERRRTLHNAGCAIEVRIEVTRAGCVIRSNGRRRGRRIKRAERASFKHTSWIPLDSIILSLVPLSQGVKCIELDSLHCHVKRNHNLHKGAYLIHYFDLLLNTRDTERVAYTERGAVLKRFQVESVLPIFFIFVESSVHLGVSL